MQEQVLVLARIGEIALKGKNRKLFVQRLLENIRYKLKPLGKYKDYAKQSRVWIEAQEEQGQAELLQARDLVCEVFGIVSASLAKAIALDFEHLKTSLVASLEAVLAKSPELKTFKVETRRANKSFPLESPEINRELGGVVLEAYPNLKVDVHEPGLLLQVEIRDQIYYYFATKEGLGGLPVGTGSKGLVLLSGGIDSPVAAYLMASRGMELEAIYFHSFPFTSDEAQAKVLELARILSRYTGPLKVHVVDFTALQVELRKSSPEALLTITMRRFMMRIAEDLAQQIKAQGLITGESLGQVASQTAEALNCTNAVVNLPIFQPLIGQDKNYVTKLAKQIGTYETSILPYEDCCTVFVPKSPKTRPSLEEAEAAEAQLDIAALFTDALGKIEVFTINYQEDERFI